MNMDMILNVAIVVFTVVAVGYLLYIGKKREASKIILAFVNEAELKFGSGTGEYKYAYVISNVYPKLPSLVRVFISQKALDKMIEKAVNDLQSKLEHIAK